MNKFAYILKMILSILQAVFIGLLVNDISSNRNDNWKILCNLYFWILIGLIFVDSIYHVVNSHLLRKQIKSLHSEISSFSQTETTRTTKTTEMTETTKTILRGKQIQEVSMKTLNK